MRMSAMPIAVLLATAIWSSGDGSVGDQLPADQIQCDPNVSCDRQYALPQKLNYDFTMDMADWMVSDYGFDAHLETDPLPNNSIGIQYPGYPISSSRTFYFPKFGVYSLTTDPSACNVAPTFFCANERYHYNDNWVKIDIEFVNRPCLDVAGCGPVLDAWRYRRFYDSSNNHLGEKWVPRWAKHGQSHSISVSYVTCLEGCARDDNRDVSTPTIWTWGPVPCEPIVDTRNGITDINVYAVVLERRREGKTERYWYAKHYNGDRTFGRRYGLVRWETFKKVGTAWTLCVGGCQHKWVVPNGHTRYGTPLHTPAYPASIPIAVLDRLAAASPCVDVCAQ